MPMNPLLPAAGSAAGPAAPAGAGRKEEPGSLDSAFTALLAALVGAQLPMIQPAQAAESATDAPSGQAAALQALIPSPGAAAAAIATAETAVPVPAAPAPPAPPTAAVAAQPAVKAPAPPLAEALEGLLQAQRVTVAAPQPLVVAQTQAPAVAKAVIQVAAQPLKTGQWLVEPLVADAVAPDPGAPPGCGPGPAPQPALPALADILTRASFRSPADSGQAARAKSGRQQTASDSAPPRDVASVAAFSLVHMAAARVDAADGAKAPAPIPSPIDPDRLMDAIAKSAVSAGDGRYTVTLRLHPDQLGEVHMQLHVIGREVQTTLQVSTPAALQALQSKGDELKRSLDQNGLTLSGFQVSTGQGERRREQEFPDDQSPRRRRGPTVGAPAGAATAARPVRRLQTRRTGSLDTLA